MQIPFWHTPGFSRHSFMSKKRKKKRYCPQDIPRCDTQGLSLLLPLTFTRFSWSNHGSEAVGTQSFKGSWGRAEDHLYLLSLKTARVCASLLLTFALSWAQLTGKPPTLSRHLAAAALGLGGVQSFRDGAFPSLEFGETEALPRVCQENNPQRSSSLRFHARKEAQKSDEYRSSGVCCLRARIPADTCTGSCRGCWCRCQTGRCWAPPRTR